MTAAALAGVVLATAGCGSSQTDTVNDLGDVIVEAGLSCQVYSQVSPSGPYAGHGSCRPRDDDRGGGCGLDGYDSEEDWAADHAAGEDVTSLIPDGCYVRGRGGRCGSARARAIGGAQTDCTA